MTPEWTGVPCDDPAELHGLCDEPPDRDQPDRAELAALTRDLKEEEDRWTR